MLRAFMRCQDCLLNLTLLLYLGQEIQSIVILPSPNVQYLPPSGLKTVFYSVLIKVYLMTRSFPKAFDNEVQTLLDSVNNLLYLMCNV